VTSNGARHHFLSVLVENRAGVLARVASLFARRGYNIYSLAVAPTDDERFSRITIVADAESAPLEQIVKQLHKLMNVIKISELDPLDSIERELMLCTVRADPTQRGQVIELVSVFGGRIVDVGHDELTVSLDVPSRLDDLEDLLSPFGIAMMQRTGRSRCPSSTGRRGWARRWLSPVAAPSRSLAAHGQRVLREGRRPIPHRESQGGHPRVWVAGACPCAQPEGVGHRRASRAPRGVVVEGEGGGRRAR
jgi:acetolactate synthase-1/3 small subunit